MAALLSPLQLQAGAALLQDQGITANVALIDKLDTYNANPLIAPIRDTIINSVGVLANSDRKSTRLNSSHMSESRMPSSA